MRRASFRRWAAVSAAILFVWGCQAERPNALPSPSSMAVAVAAMPSGKPAAPAQSSMEVTVTDVRTDPTIDGQAIRSALRDAETALLSCVDEGGSTGVLVLSFPIERDGAVGDIVEGSNTTYGSESARVCIERMVAAMRFPRGTEEGRPEVQITLEVSPRR